MSIAAVFGAISTLKVAICISPLIFDRLRPRRRSNVYSNCIKTNFDPEGGRIMGRVFLVI
jgi:hypothetical protein